jgi:hypothetical protein
MHGKKTASYEGANRKKPHTWGDAEKHGAVTMNMSGEEMAITGYASHTDHISRGGKQKPTYPLHGNYIDSSAI